MAQVRDPFALGVHRAVQPDRPQPGLPELPAYVPRDHDAELACVVRAAAEGSSGIAVLVGGSSTGKTRACWEALHLLRDHGPQWRLWHPVGPSRPDAALRELPEVGPRTVVWLDEAQCYLDPAGDVGLGERVAAGLGELLVDPARAPVLIVATLWPRFWDSLTAVPAGDADPRAEARILLDGHDIAVPAAFTAAQLRRLSQDGDARLADAAARARDGQVIQFLAGAPRLLARYRDAPAAAKAVLHAAMDARRLGMGKGLPLTFLAAAAPGYLTGTEEDALGADWLEQALGYTAAARGGVPGPLTSIPADQAGLAGVPLYGLADYLDEHGRQLRKEQVPPARFWAAAAGHASPGEQAALGDAAAARGLYRDAAQLRKNGAAHGNARAVSCLASPPPCLRADDRPMRWAVAHASLDDPEAVAELLDTLAETGARDQVTALLHRDPAAHACLDDPIAVARLLASLRAAGARDQVITLLHRDPATHVRTDSLYAMSHLAAELRAAGALEQAAALAGRAAAHVRLGEPDAVAWLLGTLAETGARDQVTALLARDPATHAPLREPGPVGWLLDALREAGARDQVTALLARDPAAHASFDDPEAVADLLDALRVAGAQHQVTALLARDPAAHVLIRDPDAVAWLLDRLRWTDAPEQVIALAARAAAHAPVDNPEAVARLLDSLREAGAPEQVTALAARAVADTPLDDPANVARRLDMLRAAGAAEQASALLARNPAAHVTLDDPGAVADLLDRLWWADAPEQVTALLARNPAAHATTDAPDAVAWLLDRLLTVGARDQVTALLARDPAAHATADDPDAIAWLLSRLRAAGAHEQAAALVGRLPGAGMFELFRAQQDREDRFRFGREADGSPARPWGWDDLS